MNDPAEIIKLSPEQLIQLYEDTLDQIDEMLATKEVIKQEFGARLIKEKRDSKEVDGWGVTRFPKVYTSKVSLEEARKFGAVKTVEKVNSAIITKLVKAGTKVLGIEVRHEVRITKLKMQAGEGEV